MVASRMLDLLLPCFPARRQSAPACWRFAQRHGVEVFRYTSVVERVVVDYHIRPAGFGIDTNDITILSSLYSHFRARKTSQCDKVAVTTSTGESALILIIPCSNQQVVQCDVTILHQTVSVSESDNRALRRENHTATSMCGSRHPVDSEKGQRRWCGGSCRNRYGQNLYAYPAPALRVCA